MERTSFFMVASLSVRRKCKRHGGDVPRRPQRAFFGYFHAHAPGVATFPDDVPTGHLFFRFIEALAAAGITGGCGTGSYCPDSPVARGQRAAFPAKALGLHWPN